MRTLRRVPTSEPHRGSSQGPGSVTTRGPRETWNGHPISDSLQTWVDLYLQHVAGALSPHSLDAKTRDLKRFVSFFLRSTGTDHLDHWTAALSRSYQDNLRSTYSPRTKRPYCPATVNRMMQSIQRFSTWLRVLRPFLLGNPLEGVRQIRTDLPEWKGLGPRELSNLRTAVDHRIKICTRQDQDPLMEAAVFFLLLRTGLRRQEVCNLSLSQYKGTGLLKVLRKGKYIQSRVPVPLESRRYLDLYIERSRGKAPGPLFLSRRGKPLTGQGVLKICERIARQANAHRSAGEEIKLTPHMLRHTLLAQVAGKAGVQKASKAAGNVTGGRHIWRYIQGGDEDLDDVLESAFLE